MTMTYGPWRISESIHIMTMIYTHKERLNLEAVVVPSSPQGLTVGAIVFK